MKSVIDEKNSVPVVSESDVLVIGGGLAGVAAAVSAARLGKKTTLIEKSIVLGGLATLGHVCIYLPICDGLGRKIYGGMAEELLQLSIKYSYNNLPDERWTMGVKRIENPKGRYRTTFNIPAYILALDELTQNEGVHVVFDTVFSKPIMDGDVCRGAIVENKSGRTAYLAKMVVDATGDADVFYRAGAPCEEQKSIVSSWAYEIDLENAKEGIESGDILKTMNLRWFGLRPDADNSKSTIPTFLGTDAEEVNSYIRLSRSLMLDYLKKNQRPGYAMFTLPFMPQYRMTRRILGKKELQLNLGHIEDSVGCICHSLETPAAVHEFPYDAIIDSKLKNMLAAGRMVAAGGYAWELMRLIPACVFTGQVAGTAAAIAIESGCAVQELKLDKLREALASTGVMIHMDEDMLGGHSEKRFNEKPKEVSIGGTKVDSLSYH